MLPHSASSGRCTIAAKASANLGLSAQPFVEWAPGTRVMPSLSVSKGFHWDTGQLLLLNGGYSSTYVDGGGNNQVTRASLSYFSRGLPRQTLAFHAAVDKAFRQDPASPLTLGEDSGLRGYSSGRYTGDRRFLMNIEDRIFIKNELWSVADIGAVVFFDSGCAWGAGKSVRVSELKNAAGLGLRVAPSRSGSNSPVRVDFAYALNDNRGRSPWLLSILAGQAF